MRYIANMHAIDTWLSNNNIRALLAKRELNILSQKSQSGLIPWCVTQ